MYTAIGTYPDGREAALEYATLDEALQKLRDWAEADERLANRRSSCFSTLRGHAVSDRL